MGRKRNKRKRKTRSMIKLRGISRWGMRLLHAGILLLCIVAVVCITKAVINSCSPPVQRTVVQSKEYNGIDVSRHNGNINWAKVASDKRIQFVYVKATEGATRVDNKYKRNISGARKNGIKVGSYHFFISWRTAREQFDNFRRNINPEMQDLIPMVDVEQQGCRTATRAQLQKNLNEFMQLVKEEYGVYPLLYSQYRFYNTYLAPEFNKYYIFIARYSNKQPTLRGDGKYNIWQFSEAGRIKGIATPVDLDRFTNGTTIDDITLK